MVSKYFHLYVQASLLCQCLQVYLSWPGVMERSTALNGHFLLYMIMINVYTQYHTSHSWLRDIEDRVILSVSTKRNYYTNCTVTLISWSKLDPTKITRDDKVKSYRGSCDRRVWIPRISHNLPRLNTTRSKHSVLQDGRLIPWNGLTSCHNPRKYLASGKPLYDSPQAPQKKKHNIHNNLMLYLI